MSYSTLTPKQKRTVQRDVETLFSPKAFVVKPTLEDIQRFGVFHPTVRYKRGIHFLSDRGVMALRRLTGIICGMKSLRDSVSEREIGAQVLQCYNDLLEKHLQPTGEELVKNVAVSLIATVKDYEFLIQLEGLDLKDQDVLELGAIRLQRADRASLEEVKFDGGLTPDSIYEQLKDSLWLTAVLAQYLTYWRNESVYNKETDWIFASSREKGRVPRAVSTCGKHYLRPAAIAAGVIAVDDRSRFGWHNLRHSLATFFGSNDVHPSVIQSMLRHEKQQTTARYIHAVNVKQIEAQGKYLDAIKIVVKDPDRAA